MNYISISLFKKVVDCALEEGMLKEDFKGLPTPIDRIASIQAVPADHFFELHERVDSLLEPGFSVRVGQQMKIEDYGVLGLSWKTCSWAGEIFERSERYFKLLSDTYVFKVDRQQDLGYIHLNRDAYRLGVALSNEATFSATVVVLQAITESTMLPEEVSFKHRAPEKLDDYQRVFNCPVSFEQPHNFIAYKNVDLERRTAKADESINRFLLERVTEETQGIEITASEIARDVETLVKDALPSGIPSIAQLSRHMGMSNRTLTRRLTESGLSFREIVTNTQMGIATNLLKNTSSSIGEIAFRTGFSEQSAFNRAFKRWTGKSPLDFRKTSS